MSSPSRPAVRLCQTYISDDKAIVQHNLRYGYHGYQSDVMGKIAAFGTDSVNTVTTRGGQDMSK